MNDLISRQAAIDALELTTRYHQNRCGEMVEGANSKEDQAWYKAEDVYKVLSDQPSAQTERKKGFWYTLKKGDKGYSAGDFKCSVCGEPNHTWLPKPKFCVNCGAEMSIYKEPVKISLGIN